MTDRLCTDPSCPDAFAEHEAHDDRPSREVPAETVLCKDPTCPNAWIEHEAH